MRVLFFPFFGHFQYVRRPLGGADATSHLFPVYIPTRSRATVGLDAHDHGYGSIYLKLIHCSLLNVTTVAS